MENTNVNRNSDIKILVDLYKQQTYCDSTKRLIGGQHEDHHQNGTFHVNNPGTDWHQTHDNSYFGK